MEQVWWRLLLLLEQKPSHIRALAISASSNHTTVRRRLLNLQKSNIVDCRGEGKNTVFFVKNSLEAKRALFIAEHKKTLATLHEYKQLRSIVECVDSLDIPLAIIFGSYAKGTCSENSDIDLYLFTDDKGIKEQVELLHSKLSVKIGPFRKDDLLIKEIIAHHIIIKGVEKFYELIYT